MLARDAFSAYHPLVNFLYFALVLVFSMCLMHPVCLGISLVCAVVYALYLGGKKWLKTGAVFLLPAALMAALINPLFNHAGVTVLTYLPSGNPLTLESILYGVAAAAMLAAVMAWFACCSAVLTSDKFVYLFGRVMPALSLLLSMVLRFVPRFRRQFQTVKQAQDCLNTEPVKGLHKIRRAVTVFSIMVTWSLENAVETADSMKSRGYGLPGRTAFSVFRMETRDKLTLLWLLLAAAYLITGWALGGFTWRYFPAVGGSGASLFTVSLQAVYGGLCLTPVLLGAAERAIAARRGAAA